MASVLLVSSKYPPEYAGSGLRAHRTYLRLREKYGLEFEVICNGLTHRRNETYRVDDVVVHRIAGPFAGIRGGGLRRPRILGDAVAEWLRTAALLRRVRPNVDLVHTFGNSSSVGAATLAAHRWGIPLIREVVNSVADPFYPIQLRGRIRGALESDCATVVAISRQLAERCKAAGVKDWRYRLNPVDETRFHPSEHVDVAGLRRRLTRFNDRDRVLVQVANFTAIKNHRFAVEVLARLPLSYKLVLRGPLRDTEDRTFAELEAVIDRLELSDRVDLRAGFVDNIEDYMRLGDVFLVPSTIEGLGTPILEAQACARPVVANRIEGVTDDTIVPGRGGFIAELDPESWARRVQEAVAIPRIVLKENARTVLARASSTTIDRWYIELIEELIARCGDARPQRPPSR